MNGSWEMAEATIVSLERARGFDFRAFLTVMMVVVAMMKLEAYEWLRSVMNSSCWG